MIYNNKKRKTLLRVTESQIHDMVKKSVKKILEHGYDLAIDDEEMEYWKDRPDIIKALRSDVDDIANSDIGRFVRRGSSSSVEYPIYKFKVDVVDDFDAINLLHPDRDPWPILTKYGVDESEANELRLSEIGGVKQMFAMSKLNKDREHAMNIRELIDADATVNELADYLEDNEVYTDVDGDLVRIHLLITAEEVMKTKDDLRKIPNRQWVDPVEDKAAIARMVK